MKTKLFLISAVSGMLLACASPEERAVKQIDSVEKKPVDSVVTTDSAAPTSSLSGTNGTGTNRSGSTSPESPR